MIKIAIIPETPGRKESENIRAPTPRKRRSKTLSKMTMLREVVIEAPVLLLSKMAFEASPILAGVKEAREIPTI
jgi:hypothetical protein